MIKYFCLVLCILDFILTLVLQILLVNYFDLPFKFIILFAGGTITGYIFTNLFKIIRSSK